MKLGMPSILSTGSTIILRAAVACMSLAVLAFCLLAIPAMWAAVSDEYPSIVVAIRSLLIVMLLASVPFFIAVKQAFNLLSYIDANTAFSLRSVLALKRIALSGIAISTLYIAALPLFYIWADQDDAPGLVVIGMVMVAAPLVVSVFAAVLQRLLRQAISIKFENDLTV